MHVFDKYIGFFVITTLLRLRLQYYTNLIFTLNKLTEIGVIQNFEFRLMYTVINQ